MSRLVSGEGLIGLSSIKGLYFDTTSMVYAFCVASYATLQQLSFIH